MTTDSATIDIDRLQASFKVKNAELRCPVCSSEDMVVLDPALSVPQDVYWRPKSIKTVSVACGNCGLVRQFVQQILLREPGVDNGGQS
jgi:C4-type Zn-finger protein